MFTDVSFFFRPISYSLSSYLSKISTNLSFLRHILKNFLSLQFGAGAAAGAIAPDGFKGPLRCFLGAFTGQSPLAGLIAHQQITGANGAIAGAILMVMAGRRS